MFTAGQFIRLSGLPNEPVSQIRRDGKGRIWTSTPSGIYRRVSASRFIVRQTVDAETALRLSDGRVLTRRMVIHPDGSLEVWLCLKSPNGCSARWKRLGTDQLRTRAIRGCTPTTQSTCFMGDRWLHDDEECENRKLASRFVLRVAEPHPKSSVSRPVRWARLV